MNGASDSVKSPAENLSVQTLSGVAAQTAARLGKLGIVTVQDLLLHAPLRYEDRTRIAPMNRLTPGQRALVEGRISNVELLVGRRRSLVCRLSDGGGDVFIRFFHFGARQKSAFSDGTRLRCFGEVRYGYYGLEMVHPEYQMISDSRNALRETRLTPVYPLTEGIRQSTMRRLVKQALQFFIAEGGEKRLLPEWVPETVLRALGYSSIGKSVAEMHAPAIELGVELTIEDHPARGRLAFEELLAHHLSLQQARAATRSHRAPIIKACRDRETDFLDCLPFTLTAAQLRVIVEIQADLASGMPMMRLIQGDVGSGKTVVAAYSALSVLAAGYQVAVMAPTELLAEQHYSVFSKWLEPLDVDVAVYASKHKGAVRRELVDAIRDGRTGFVVGTHALFQDSVEFHRLGMIIIDEQHRFGVDQRLALSEKAKKQGIFPHQLVMTATPIPRTLAMLRFSDLEISVIDQPPPDRIPVKTSVIPSTRRGEVIVRINQWIGAGKQAYWVCTLIDDSEVLQCQAAEKTNAKLAEFLPELRIGLIHGRLKAVEKESVMQAFKQGEIDLLVATTVIEVGVDVANAGLMIIENPERLGLSQLHQLRGRVGRGPGDSFCLLMYQAPLSDMARQRLAILRESSDGFEIAEKDLELRGPGEVLGTRQTGQIQFRIADLSNDKKLIPKVIETAELIEKDHPECIQPLIDRWLGSATQYARV